MEPVGKTAGFFFSEPLASGCVYHSEEGMYHKSTDLRERVMSIIDAKTDEELQQEFAEMEAMMAEEDKKLRKKAIVSWVLSGAMHMIVMLMIGTIAFASMNVEEEAPPVRVSILPVPPVKTIEDDKKKFVDEITDPLNIVEHDQEVTADKTIISDIDEVVTEITSEDENNSKDAKGREEAVSDSELGGNGAFIAIGPGGGGKGLYGRRTGGGDKRVIGKAFGPHSKGVTTTLDAALRWLKKHQSENGMWSAANYFQNCPGDLKCEPGKGANGGDEAMTGYAVLCFLGAGYDHKTPNKYKQVVNKGIEWILANQKPDGLIGNRNYEHPVAAMALVEAYGMTNDPALREPSQKAINIIIARQSLDPKAADKEYAGLGWDYINQNASRNDSSVTGWNVMALKSAHASGISVQNSLEGSKKWLEGAWKAANPNWAKLSDPYKDTSIFPYVWNANEGTTQKDHLSFIGALCAVFLGHRDGDIMLESMLNDMDKRWLDTGKYKDNAYAIYYASLAAFQSGDHWKKWRDAYVPYLIDTQWKEDAGECKSGTWNYGKQDFHGSETSRVLIHCYYTLSLEVAIRYDQVNKKK